MKAPAELAQHVEQHSNLPAGDDERFAGYSVMGLPFRSGHVLGLRRFPSSSVGEAFTSVWHRDPAGRGTFYQTASPETACTRYFGDEVECVHTVPIELEWPEPNRLHIRAGGDAPVDWTLNLGSTAATRTMSALGSAMPAAAWRSPTVLKTVGRVAQVALRLGRVQLSGTVPNGQEFVVNPMRIWLVTDSDAVVDGVELGPVGPLSRQAHLADFYLPQRGVFVIGDAHLRAPG